MTRKPRRAAPAIPIGATLADAYRLTFTRLGRWLVLALVVQGAVAIIGAPVLAAVFQSGLAAAGIGSLTTATLVDVVANPWSIVLLVLLLLLTVAALVIQTAIVALAAEGQQNDVDGRLPRPRALARAVARRARALVRPSTLLLLPYLLLLAPLGHAALGSLLTRWIAVPNFISGELLRSPSGTVLWLVISLVLWYVNIRLILTVPFAAAGGLTVPQAFRASWSATRWRTWRMVVVILAVIVPTAVVLLALTGIAFAATALADVVAPDASALVAAIAFSVVQVTGFFVLGIAVAVQTQAFVRIVRLNVDAPVPVPVESAPTARPGLRWVGGCAALAALAAVVVTTIAALPGFSRVADGTTLVIAHRGVTDRAVENTLEALEAAAAAGADAVEFDVQQTADGDWVVMHDFDLMRLAGISGAVADMTLAEATAITVRDGDHEGRVPSMREWVDRAVELGIPMLIEIKPHGGETSDYLERFYAILDEAGVTDASLYHSLSADVVAGQTARHPETTVGYIVAIALGAGLPDSPADFLVVEEFSYTDGLREQLHDSGRGLFVWTVNDENAMRGYLRDGVDGIITDHAAVLIEQRAAIADETGLAPKLLDALGRAVTLW